MFSLLEIGDRNASVFAFISSDNMIVHKAPIRSSEMFKTKERPDLQNLPIMMSPYNITIQYFNKFSGYTVTAALNKSTLSFF